MHYTISTTWGPTDTTRAALPFIFAEAAADSGDTAMIMLFHDSILLAVKGTHELIVPVGPKPNFKTVFGHDAIEVIVCKPCAEARGITEDMLVPGCRMGGMGDFLTHAARPDSKQVTF